jgi:histidine triad (HIT) family protein
MKTIFEKIIDREIPSTIEYEDESIIAFRDVTPQAPIHILIVPKKRVASINECDVEDTMLLGELLLVAKKLAMKLKIQDNGYRLVINTGKDAGQTVFHLHIHFLAGRDLNWPPG